MSYQDRWDKLYKKVTKMHEDAKESRKHIDIMDLAGRADNLGQRFVLEQILWEMNSMNKEEEKESC